MSWIVETLFKNQTASLLSISPSHYGSGICSPECLYDYQSGEKII